ncbi:17945_t:CDS:2, partial [Racocetra persica]
PKKRALDSYSQDEKNSKSTKYNSSDSARTFWESNTNLLEDLSLNNAKTYNKIPDDQEIQIFFYSATCNGSVRFGLPKHHVLNITKVSKAIMQHIFPKQFGLRNVFDHDKNGQPS